MPNERRMNAANFLLKANHVRAHSLHIVLQLIDLAIYTFARRVCIELSTS